jgi:hypothetical protein
LSNISLKADAFGRTKGVVGVGKLGVLSVVDERSCVYGDELVGVTAKKQKSWKRLVIQVLTLRL